MKAICLAYFKRSKQTQKPSLKEGGNLSHILRLSESQNKTKQNIAIRKLLFHLQASSYICIYSESAQRQLDVQCLIYFFKLLFAILYSCAVLRSWCSFHVFQYFSDHPYSQWVFFFPRK